MTKKPTPIPHPPIVAAGDVRIFNVPNGAGRYAARVAEIGAVHISHKPGETEWTVTLETVRGRFVVVDHPFAETVAAALGGKPGDYK